MDNRFLDLLTDLHRGGQYGYWWTPEGEQYTDKDGVLQWAARSLWWAVGEPSTIPAVWTTKDLYFNVHPSKVKRSERQRTRIEDVAAVNCVYAEWDLGPQFPAMGDILAHLDRLKDAEGIPFPTAIIASGGGAHGYWVTEKPQVLTDGNRDTIKAIQYAWNQLVGGDPSVKDFARVLRIPGYLNRKPEYEPNYPTVEIIEYSRLRVYDFGEFADLTAHLRPSMPAQCPQPQARQAIPLDDSELWDVAFNSQFGNEIYALYNGDYSRYVGHDGKPDHSTGDYHLCRFLAFYTARDPDRIDRMFMQSGMYRPEKWDRADYKERTIKRAIAATSKDYSTNYDTAEREEAIRMGQLVINTNGREKSAQEGGVDKVQPTLAMPRINLTELGNARRLVRLHGQDLHYVYKWGKWLIWDGARWAEDETGEIARLAKGTVASIYAEAANADDDNRKTIAKWALSSESQKHINAMIALAQSEPGIPISDQSLDGDPMLLNCPNGTVDLRANVLHPHRRDDLITKMIGTPYDPDADCPLWLAFLDRIMDGDAEMIGFLQRAAGYSLTGDVSEQCLFFEHGTGRNGKSTFTETMLAMLGDYGQKAPTEMIMQRNGGVPNDIARLRGARMAVTAEIEEGKRLAESTVKDLTGGDTITARYMRAEWFEFKPSHKLWVYGNHKPAIRGTDDGIWRRLHLIPFDVKIPESEQDPHLAEKLRDELPGILAWAVRGCLEWQRDGLRPPAAVRAATTAYRAESDTLSAFLSECTVQTAKAETKASELYNAYKEWCEDNGERPLNGTRFGRQLSERGFDKVKTYLGTFYLGLGITE